MLTVAVTGGIGAGKSTVSRLLGAQGAQVVDSDQVARDVVAPGTQGLTEIVEAFGPAVLDPAGALDRGALAAAVFADPAARVRLEEITHPRVRAAFDQAQCAAAADAVLINDIPLLRDVATAARFHLVLGVTAPEETRVARLVGRGMAETDARARLRSQITDAQRAALCDIWWVNDGPAETLAPRVEWLWQERIRPFQDNIAAGRCAPRGGPVLVDPDPSWAPAGIRLAARVSRAAGGARVDHIGSTAVPGLAAKDVIDLQLTVDRLADVDELDEPLRVAGFPRMPGDWSHTHHEPSPDSRPWAVGLHANADPGQKVNLHLRVRDSPGWRWALLLPAWLRAESAVRQDYVAVKRQLAASRELDWTIDGYAEADRAWLERMYPRGLAWARATGWSPDGLGAPTGGGPAAGP